MSALVACTAVPLQCLCRIMFGIVNDSEQHQCGRGRPTGAAHTTSYESTSANRRLCVPGIIIGVPLPNLTY